MKKYAYILAFIAFTVSLLCLFFIYQTNQKLKALTCDAIESVYAEREYTYPILRTIGQPENEGLGIKNPLTTQLEYNELCFD